MQVKYKCKKQYYVCESKTKFDKLKHGKDGIIKCKRNIAKQILNGKQIMDLFIQQKYIDISWNVRRKNCAKNSFLYNMFTLITVKCFVTIVENDSYELFCINQL